VIPLVLGQALAYATCGRFSWGRAGLALLFGVLDQLFIVFANDCADWQGDALNTTHNAYSGGSRVVPEGKLSPDTLARAALLMVLWLGGFSAYVTVRLELMWMLLLCTISVALLWAYSFPPLRLAYRGQGEILQGLGLGVVLPAVGFYLQCGELSAFPVWACLPAFLLGYAGNITTALPDVPADRAVGKRSFPVRHSQRSARIVSLLLIGIAACSAPLLVPRASAALVAVLIGAPLACLALNVTGLRAADATNRALCLRFVTLNGAAICVTQLGWIVALFALD
jgi:1,4-dihydroxy-2-naphthoate polyprenyltransferase